MDRSDWGRIYKELGATPIINAIGSLTLLGGSTIDPEIRAAMDAADDAYIPLTHLEEKAGAVIAGETGVPAAYVTSGAGSALTLASAAAMAGDDDDLIQRLPNTTGMRNEILLQRRQRYWYDRCLELAGATLVEFGSDDGTTRVHLERAIGPNTAAVAYVVKEEQLDPQVISLKETIEVAHAAGVPVIVDSAGQVFPLQNIGKYVRMGADVQVVATKYIGAPHSTGLALGTEDFIYKLGLQSFASYEGRRVRGVGRPHKVDRQEIMAVVAATHRWMTMDQEARLAVMERRCNNVLSHIVGIAGLNATFVENVTGHHAYGVDLMADPVVCGLSNEDIIVRLKEGDPPIWTRIRDGERHIRISPFGLKDGEDHAVGERIAALFGR